ncbi:MAG: hypothetical protein ACI835_004672 [Planctomycetota bacterium]|jgi:uncharacterized protein (DUF1501 family)
MTNDRTQARQRLFQPNLDLGRRSLLAGAALLLGMQSPLLASALQESKRRKRRGRKKKRSLVVLQLSGGNDGLSTVVPYADDAYAEARDATRFSRKHVLRIDDYRGFHPELKQIRSLYDQGKVALVEGVGYPDSPRSHFKSLEIWHSAHSAGRAAGDGWLGKLAAELRGTRQESNLCVHVGGAAPYSLHSSVSPAIAFESPSEFRWFGDERERAAYGGAGLRAQSGGSADMKGKEAEDEDKPAGNGRDEMLKKLRGVLDGAQDSSARIRAAANAYRPSVSYPEAALGARLHDIAALIHSDFGARIYSATLSGFDTHSDQRGRHSELMQGLDESLGAFVTDLQHSEAGRDTLVLVYSEFGRRVVENGSAGTDHGKAGPMFLLGDRVSGGLHGQHPSLADLDEGDLRHTTDFRSVFGSVIDRWFGCDPEAVLGASYPQLDLFG